MGHDFTGLFHSRPIPSFSMLRTMYTLNIEKLGMGLETRLQFIGLMILSSNPIELQSHICDEALM